MSFREHMHTVSIGYCYGLNVYVPSNSPVETLIPTGVIFGGRVHEEVIKVK